MQLDLAFSRGSKRPRPGALQRPPGRERRVPERVASDRGSGHRARPCRESDTPFRSEPAEINEHSPEKVLVRNDPNKGEVPLAGSGQSGNVDPTTKMQAQGIVPVMCRHSETLSRAGQRPSCQQSGDSVSPRHAPAPSLGGGLGEAPGGAPAWGAFGVGLAKIRGGPRSAGSSGVANVSKLRTTALAAPSFLSAVLYPEDLHRT